MRVSELLNSTNKILSSHKALSKYCHSSKAWSQPLQEIHPVSSLPEALSSNSINGINFCVYPSVFGSGFNPICLKLGQYVHLLLV